MTEENNKPEDQANASNDAAADQPQEAQEATTPEATAVSYTHLTLPTNREV